MFRDFDRILALLLAGMTAVVLIVIVVTTLQ
jgi:hypothetical protein